MSEKLIELFKNEEFCVNFFEAIDKTDELKSLLGKNGINISDEELKELIDVAKQQMAKVDNEELNEDELDDVSGGVVGWIVAGVVCGIFFGYQTYKAKTAFNGTFCS